MPRNLIIDLFYNEIVPEAQTGRVDAYFTMNLAFNLTINNKPITSTPSINYDDVIIPTLKITKKTIFDYLLVEYVYKAMKTYKEENFLFLIDVEYIYPKEDVNVG